MWRSIAEPLVPSPSLLSKLRLLLIRQQIVTFSGGLCSGGHGLSIGSVGGRDDNTVDTVKFESSTVTKSTNGIRIKATAGDTGVVKGVTYSGITLSGITRYSSTVATSGGYC